MDSLSKRPYNPSLPDVHPPRPTNEIQDVKEVAVPVYLTPTHILEYLYCPRFTYFEYVLHIPEHQEKRLKVQRGREVHEERQNVNPGYLRKKLGVVKRELGVKLASLRHHLSGVVDEVLWLEDGTMAPFDYKFAKDTGRVFENQRVQSVLYGNLIRENYSAAVTRGFLCYTRSNYKVKEIPMAEEDFRSAERIVLETLEVIRTGVFPRATRSKARCNDCCYRNICIH